MLHKIIFIFANFCCLKILKLPKFMQARQLQFYHSPFFYEACRIDELSTGSVLGYKILTFY
jgi:hypothetical protein